uniref:T9SS type A sorting domain-containing protein n=1 Tax=candidate division WOR-3 bacterium TaxID=2052148 RepID=A0A7C4YFN6_UNCW3
MYSIILIFSLTGKVVSIYEIQHTLLGSSDSSAYHDSTVTTYGIVTGKYPAGFFMEEKPGGEWRGIYVYGTSYLSSLNVGDSVKVTGKVKEYYGLTEISLPTEVVVLGNTTFSPTIVPTGDAKDEKYEGCFLRVENAVCTSLPNQYNEWLVNDGSGNLKIDDLGYAFTPVLGDTYTVMGCLYYSYGEFKLEPRDDRDIIEPGEIEGFYVDIDPLRCFVNNKFNLKMIITTPLDTVKFLKIFIPKKLKWSKDINDIIFDKDITYDSVRIDTFTTGDTIRVWKTNIFDTKVITIKDFLADTIDTFKISVFGSGNNVIFSKGGETKISSMNIPDKLLPIREVQRPGQDGYSSAHYLDTVFVLGYAVTGNLSSTFTSFYINDTTGGVNVYYSKIIPIKENYLYLFKGIVDEYKGLTEVKIIDTLNFFVISRFNEPFPPETLPQSRPLGESDEGRLVCVKDAMIVTPVSPIPSGGGYNFTIANGQAYMTVRIESGTGVIIDSIINMRKGEIWTITGICGQYDSYEPYTTGYQILPRRMSDLIRKEVEDSDVVIVNITPNPFAYDEGEVSNITINVPPGSSLTAKIFDLDGRLVKEICSNYSGSLTTQWNGNDYKERKVTIGAYILNVIVKKSNGKIIRITKPIVVGTKLGR